MSNNNVYYHANGQIRGPCGHKHKSVEMAKVCADADERGCKAQGGYSDRVVMVWTREDALRVPTSGPVTPAPIQPAAPEAPKKEVDAELVGYVRRSRAGGALKINICASAFERARRYVSQDGQEYVGLVVSLDKVRSVIDGEREVTSVMQIVEGA